ncbi:MAG: riboflavin synthase, partial [Spirochaetota bacterium]
CIDGVSLTVVDQQGDFFDLYIIPESVSRTTLGSLRTGDDVNIETDIIAKYVEKMMEKRSDDSSLMNALAENGFL